MTLEKDKLYTLVHIGGNLAGARWPAIFVGETTETSLGKGLNGKYSNFIYLQFTDNYDNRLSRASALNASFKENNGDVALKSAHKIVYSTAEGPFGKLSLADHKSLLERLVSVKHLVKNADTEITEEALA